MLQLRHADRIAGRARRVGWVVMVLVGGTVGAVLLGFLAAFFVPVAVLCRLPWLVRTTWAL